MRAGVCVFPCPKAVQGSVGTDGNMGPCPVCGVRHRSSPSSSPVLPPVLCVKGPHGHCLQQGLGFLSRAPEPRGTSVRAPHNWSPTPSSLWAELVVRTGLCGPQAGSELNLWSWRPQSPSSSPWGHDHRFPVGDVCSGAVHACARPRMLSERQETRHGEAEDRLVRSSPSDRAPSAGTKPTRAGGEPGPSRIHKGP